MKKFILIIMVILIPILSFAALPIDINAANIHQLMSLPGIGEARAKLIIDRRTKRPFRSKEEIILIKGIGPKQYQQLKELIVATPIDKAK